ncbi:MAG: hypothetical protein LBQ57_09870 [Spirochaetales bacterium]|jgi:hypothetical protein|nr:hypothetical protein [Spirochaetales bacterium]
MKTWISLLAALFIAENLCSLDVAEQEVRTTETVTFENNEGAPAKVETADQIRGIGTVLGQNLNAGGQYYGRYRLIHVVDPSEKDLFDADILILESSAAVDHIRNLRFILAGFLSAAYGYSPQDAALLSRFITIYNAVYRKNMPYFASKYKAAVIANLDPAKAGLSTSWRDWPGGTQILIPLSDATPGSLDAVDTGAISDTNVVEDLRAAEDKGIEERKELLDLKERQIEEQERKSAEEKKAVQEERRQVEDRQKQVEKDIAAVQEEKKAVEEGRKPATEEEKKELDKKETELREEQAAVEEDKKAVERKEAEVAARETRTEEKKEEVREDRKEIAKDQEEVLQKDSLAAIRGIPFIKVDSAAKGRLLLIDPQSGEALADTPEQPVMVRQYESFGGGIVVIMQRQGGDSGRLAVLERGSLKEKISAREEVYPESSLQVNGSELFAVIRDQGKWYLGKYDSAMALIARSKTEVNPRTFILFSDAHVFVEDPAGKVAPLSLANMD